MAVMQTRDNRSFEAGEDLSAAQFHFVTLETSGAVALAAAAGGNCIGVLLNAPAAVGRAATVAISGKVMVEAGATIVAGDAIQTNAAGEAIPAATGGYIMGYALEAGVDGQIIAMELIQGGNISA